MTGPLGQPACSSRLTKLLSLCLLLQLLLTPAAAQNAAQNEVQTARSSTGDKAAAKEKASLLRLRPVDREDEDPYIDYKDSHYNPPSWEDSNYGNSNYYQVTGYDSGYSSGAEPPASKYDNTYDKQHQEQYQESRPGHRQPYYEKRRRSSKGKEQQEEEPPRPPRFGQAAGQTYIISTIRRAVTGPLTDLASSMRNSPQEMQANARSADQSASDSREMMSGLARLRRRPQVDPEGLAATKKGYQTWQARQDAHRARPIATAAVDAAESAAEPAEPAAVAAAAAAAADSAEARIPIQGPGGAKAVPPPGAARVLSRRPQDGYNYGHEGYGLHHSDTKTRPKVQLSFDGLNAFEQRFANNGNQFTLDPPDQGLCVGNSFVLEVVNTVLRVYDAVTGAPLLSPVDLNTFFGFPAQFNRATNVFGPGLFDPICVYDQDAGRWFLVVAAYDVNPENDERTGPSYIELAVSDTYDPTGSWTLYRIQASNNGNSGTPNAACGGGFCFADYPQIAVWEHALIITTNEFDFNLTAFSGANVYAIDKAALVQGKGAAKTALVRTDTGVANDPRLIFSLQPARQTGPGVQRSTPNTYLMATLQAITRGEHTVQLFSLLGTETLATKSAWVSLEWVQPAVELGVSYSVPPDAVQRPGVNPYGQVDFGTSEVPMVSTGDARMRSVSFVDDLLYCTWATAIKGRTKPVSGVAYAVIDPKKPAKALDSGFLRPLGDDYVMYPFMAVGPGGVGVLAVSITGPDYYPSPAYAGFSREGFGPLIIIVPGAGVLDTFTGYTSDIFTSRFGDYSAAAMDATGAFWIASEYVAQTCTVAEFNSTAGTCGDTRAPAANWATRVTRIALPPY